MSTVRTTVIESFLTAVDDDDAIPPGVATGIRELFTPAVTAEGKLPSIDQILSVIRTHAADGPSTGTTGSTA